MIAAVADNGVIGVDNGLPWRLPKEMKEFKRRTMGHHLIMGRKTWESVGVLAGRTTIVLSRSQLSLPAGVLAASSLDEALACAAAAGEEEAFVAGGGEVYRQALGRAERLYLTRVHAEIEGDTTFPSLDDSWMEVSRCDEEPDERNAYGFSLLVLERSPSTKPAVP